MPTLAWVCCAAGKYSMLTTIVGMVAIFDLNNNLSLIDRTYAIFYKGSVPRNLGHFWLLGYAKHRYR